MKKVPLLAVAILAGSSLSLMAQQPDQAAPQNPAAPAPPTQSAPQSRPSQASPAGTTAAPLEMSVVTGELVTRLDSKSAKAGDRVEVKTSEPVKTADGTVIPKGSKLVGHVAKVQSHSRGSENSAMILDFDHAELKGGQNVQIASVIKSLAPAAGNGALSGGDSGSSPMPASPSAGGGMGARQGSGAAIPGSTASVPQPDAAAAATNAGSAGAATAGTVVGKMGNDPIRSTAIPGVYLASMNPSEATTMSGVLFAAKSEVHLDDGTQVGLEVAVANGGKSQQ